jgi:DNA-binding winged helix-turn-helix (wHTH) protein/Flp pilus assembly protein TadD
MNLKDEPHQEVNLLSRAKEQERHDLRNAVISAPQTGWPSGSRSRNDSSEDRFIPATSQLRFGVFEVNLRERELRKLGLRVRVPQKPFQVLVRLLRTPGEFVSREELAQLLWPDLYVRFDRSLNTAVNLLRRALGDHGRNPRFIETRPGLGYVFIAPVEQIALAQQVKDPPRVMAADTARPGNGQAYQDCLKGRYFANKMTDADLRTSIAYFESALRHESNYAPAYAGLADTWLLFAFHGLHAPQECLSHARKWADAALRADDFLAESHTSQGGVRRLCDGDWDGAESSYQRALKLDPNHAAAHRHFARHLASMGRFEEALEKIHVAQELDPLSLVINVEMAWILYMSRDFAGAAEQSWKTLAMEPRFAPAQNTLGLAYEQLGMFEEAIVELDNARVCSENHPAAVASLACGFAIAGRVREAEESLADLKRMARTRIVSAYWFSMVHASLGECDLALESLDQACGAHDVWLVWLNVEPRFDRLRNHARFEDVLQKIGLSQRAASA